MKALNKFALLFALFCVNSAYGQNPASAPPPPEPPPMELDFNTLRDQLNSYDKRRVGNREVVELSLQPNLDRVGFAEMLKKRANANEVVLFSAVELAERLRPQLSEAQTRARVTLTLIEVKQRTEVSLAAFVTKVEGLKSDGSIAWTETGTPPAEVKFNLASPLHPSRAMAIRLVATKVDQ